MIAASAGDIVIIAILALDGIEMRALSIAVTASGSVRAKASNCATSRAARSTERWSAPSASRSLITSVARSACSAWSNTAARGVLS